MTLRIAVIIFLSAILFGCAKPKMIRDDYDQRASGIRSIGVLAPKLAYFDLTFGGAAEKSDEWSEQTSQNVVAAIKDVLSARGFEVKMIAREGGQKENLEEIADLFDIIAFSYRNHVLAAREIDKFPHKVASFDYSVGPIDDVLDAYHVDALLLVEGSGSGNSSFVRGSSVLLVTLIDRTGALLWYDPYVRQESGFTKEGIRDPAKVRAYIEEIIGTLPAVRK